MSAPLLVRLRPNAAYLILLVVAVALVVAWSSLWPVWLAVGLLALFTVFVVRAAVRHTPCPCFGASVTTACSKRRARGSIGGSAGRAGTGKF